jgi:integrase
VVAVSRRHNGEGSIFPYRSGYAAYAWITTPAGRRQRKYVYGKNRRTVHEKWLKLTQAAKAGPVAPRSMRLADFMARWLAETVQPDLAPTTAANYALFTRLYIGPDLGSKRLDRLTVRDVQLWMNKLKTRCQCCHQGKDSRRPKDRRRCCAVGACCHQVASEWTRHQAWTVLQSALSAAVREELLTRNVAALVRVPVPRPKRAKAWTAEQSRRFLESARADDDPLYAAYVLMLVLGLRRGELLGLAWDDVDVSEATAWIGWQLQRVNGGLVRRQTKTSASDAPLPLPDICIRALEERRQVEARWRAVAPDWRESGLVFTSRLGTPVDPRNFHRAFLDRAKRAGVPVTPVHLTRKACASLLVALDVHPRVAMQILRHSKIAVTMEVYAEVVSSSTKDALRRLGEQLDSGIQA